MREPRPTSLDDNTLSDGCGPLEDTFNLLLEMEGLLTLMMRRETAIPKQVHALLAEKLTLLATKIHDLPLPQGEEPVKATPKSSLTPEEIFHASLPSLPGLEDEEEEEELEAITPIVAEEPAPYTAPDREESLFTRQNFSEPDQENEEAAKPESEPALAPAAPAMPRKPKPGDLRKKITINDKFRFRRELFCNSDAAFSAALTDIEELPSAKAAMDFMEHTLKFDMDSPVVKEFATVVERFFNPRPY